MTHNGTFCTPEIVIFRPRAMLRLEERNLGFVFIPGDARVNC